MVRKLQTHWVLWGGLVIFFAIGLLVCLQSSLPAVTSISLVPNSSVNVTVFRPFPDMASVSMEFNNPGRQGRPLLGNSRGGGDWQKTGFLYFGNPGEPIKVRVSVAGKAVVYEALPTSGYGATSNRDLVPFVDDGEPNRFQWPPENRLRNKLPAGYSDITVTILEVGAQLKGERVKLIIKPPVDYMSFKPNYGLIWPFIYWQLYTLPLLVYGLVLLWFTIRQQGRLG